MSRFPSTRRSAVGDNEVPARRRRAQEPGRAQGVAFAGVIGALAGLALSPGRRIRSRIAGASVGAVVLAASEATARWRQRPNEIPALWHRILMSSALAAPPAWLLGRMFRLRPMTVGAGAGALAGAMGLRPQKVVLGPVFGTGMGWLLARRNP